MLVARRLQICSGHERLLSTCTQLEPENAATTLLVRQLAAGRVVSARKGDVRVGKDSQALDTVQQQGRDAELPVGQEALTVFGVWAGLLHKCGASEKYWAAGHAVLILHALGFYKIHVLFPNRAEGKANDFTLKLLNQVLGCRDADHPALRIRIPQRALVELARRMAFQNQELAQTGSLTVSSAAMSVDLTEQQLDAAGDILLSICYIQLVSGTCDFTQPRIALGMNVAKLAQTMRRQHKQSNQAFSWVFSGDHCQVSTLLAVLDIATELRRELVRNGECSHIMVIPVNQVHVPQAPGRRTATPATPPPQPQPPGESGCPAPCLLFAVVAVHLGTHIQQLTSLRQAMDDAVAASELQLSSHLLLPPATQAPPCHTSGPPGRAAVAPSPSGPAAAPPTAPTGSPATSGPPSGVQQPWSAVAALHSRGRFPSQLQFQLTALQTIVSCIQHDMEQMECALNLVDADGRLTQEQVHALDRTLPGLMCSPVFRTIQILFEECVLQLRRQLELPTESPLLQHMQELQIEVSTCPWQLSSKTTEWWPALQVVLDVASHASGGKQHAAMRELHTDFKDATAHLHTPPHPPPTRPPLPPQPPQHASAHTGAAACPWCGRVGCDGDDHCPGPEEAPLLDAEDGLDCTEEGEEAGWLPGSDEHALRYLLALVEDMPGHPALLAALRLYQASSPACQRILTFVTVLGQLRADPMARQPQHYERWALVYEHVEDEVLQMPIQDVEQLVQAFRECCEERGDFIPVLQPPAGRLDTSDSCSGSSYATVAREDEEALEAQGPESDAAGG